MPFSFDLANKKKSVTYTLRMSDLMAIIGDDANDTQRRY